MVDHRGGPPAVNVARAVDAIAETGSSASKPSAGPRIASGSLATWGIAASRAYPFRSATRPRMIACLSAPSADATRAFTALRSLWRPQSEAGRSSRSEFRTWVVAPCRVGQTRRPSRQSASRPASSAVDSQSAREGGTSPVSAASMSSTPPGRNGHPPTGLALLGSWRANRWLSGEGAQRPRQYEPLFGPTWASSEAGPRWLRRCLASSIGGCGRPGGRRTLAWQPTWRRRAPVVSTASAPPD